MDLAHSAKALGYELRAVIQANGQRRAPHLDEIVQGPHDPGSRQAGVDLNAQAFPVVFIDDVERPEAPARPQCVGYEVAIPALVRVACCQQWLHDACRQPLLAAPWKIQPKLAVHPPQHCLAPVLHLVAGAVLKQVKAMARVERHVALDEDFERASDCL